MKYRSALLALGLWAHPALAAGSEPSPTFQALTMLGLLSANGGLSVTGALTLPANSLTFAEMPTISAGAFLCNSGGSTAVPAACTPTTATAQLNPCVGDTGSGGTKGLVPPAPSGAAAAGKFLKADCTFAVPPAPGGRILINTITGSGSATLQDTTSFTSAYTEYEIVFENVVFATASQVCELRIHTSGAFAATSYVASGFVQNQSGSSGIAGTTYIPCSNSASGDAPTTAPGISGTFRVSNVAGTTQPKTFFGQFGYNSSAGVFASMHVAGYWNGNTAVDGIEVLSTSGMISGTIKIYVW